MSSAAERFTVLDVDFFWAMVNRRDSRMSSMYRPHQAQPQRCPRGHPIDGPACYLCRQEDEAQERADDKLLAALGRLVRRGKLHEEILREKE